MNRGFSKLDNQNHCGETNTWLTPIEIVQSFGNFDLDPCAYPNHKTAKNLITLPMDGLSADWRGSVWLNPPYGNHTAIWLDKLYRHGVGVALVFARTETKWFQKYAELFDWVFFLKGRIKFINPANLNTTNAGHGSCFMGIGMDFRSSLSGLLWHHHKESLAAKDEG